MSKIDLRSDTVTLPSREMREAMAKAPVGDDQYGEDPTVNELQSHAAHLLGKERALFVASGTLANQIALKVFTRPGDDVIVGEQSHAVFHETGAAAANSGVQFTEVGKGGLFSVDEFRAAYKAPGHIVYPPTTLVEVENTHNRGGGLIFPESDTVAICKAARELKVATYLDGARLFNAAVATGSDPARMAAPFDLVAVSLSKGLGAPVGSVLVGSRPIIEATVRYRRMLGGAMRQCGIVAAAGLYALKHNIDRMAVDHANARLIAERLASIPLVEIEPETVRTNIVVFRIAPTGPSAFAVVEECRRQGVLVLAFSERIVRLVTHLDVDAERCRRAADVIADAVGSIAKT
jgi:threonine aldolase